MALVLFLNEADAGTARQEVNFDELIGKLILLPGSAIRVMKFAGQFVVGEGNVATIGNGQELRQ